MIVVKGLTKMYPGETLALDNVTFTIPRGQMAFLVGPNGAGKTTLFKLLIREERPTSGCILFDGVDVSTLKRRQLERHRRRIGAIFQDVRLLPYRTVFENVALPLEADGLRGEAVNEKVAATLFLSGLEALADRFPSELSGGQQQQVAVARALVSHPEVILADEPTGNLSPDSTQRVMRLFRVISELGIAVIVSTHNREIVDDMRRRVLVLESGRLVDDIASGAYPLSLIGQAA
ncbi:MAG TPA: ATP-binding cassette domain-containing protein [Chloroflexota bacterium]|nr:ATP-binding cassette domain-containing protein [Chloroflexota bacterium]